MWISYGGIQELSGEGVEDVQEEGEFKKVFNTHVLVSDCGEAVGVYRKIHLFDVSVPNGPVLRESRYTAKGGVEDSNLIVIPSPFGFVSLSLLFSHFSHCLGNIGLTTCYDVRFPELYSILQNKGADIILVPSAFTVPTGQAGHWEILLRARAIGFLFLILSHSSIRDHLETQTYIMAAAQVGSHSEKRQSYGHAMIVDPWGRVLADCETESSSLGIVELGFFSLPPFTS